MLDLSRRRFCGFLAAPAIVRATSLMPVKAFAYDKIYWTATHYSTFQFPHDPITEGCVSGVQFQVDIERYVENTVLLLAQKRLVVHPSGSYSDG